MSKVKFSPNYELIIGRPSKLNNLVIPSSLVNPNKLKQGVNGINENGIIYNHSLSGNTLPNGDYLDYNTIPAKFWSIRDLQVVANFPQTKDQAVKCSVVVTNLSDNIVNFIKKDDLIIFRAGYQTVEDPDKSLPDIFIGQIQRVNSVSDGVNRTTTIDCAEGQTVRKNSRITYHWPPKTTRETVIRTFLKLLGSQGIPTGAFTMPPVGSEEYDILKKTYLSGYSAQGYTLEELTKVCEACRMYCYVALGKLYVEPRTITGNIPLQTRNIKRYAVFQLYPSDVIGQIQPKSGNSDGGPTNKDSNKLAEELSLTVYLDGSLTIDKVVKLTRFDEYNGDYRVTSLTHKYNHRGKGCETLITLKAISNGY